MAAARVQAMEKEGATVSIIDGDYDDAVARSGQEASDTCIVVSDTSWPGYETTPSQVIEGYSTIFKEIDDAIDSSGIEHPDLVVVPMGVGAFMAAAITHYRGGGRSPLIAGVEPLDANCCQVSSPAGDIAHVPGPHESIMVGLNCGRPSLIAWPRLASGIDWFVSVDDDAARDAMRALAESAVVAGETGGASLAGLRALLANEEAAADLGDLSEKTALVIVTERATDPGAYEKIVGRGHDSIGRVLTAMR